MLAHKDLLHYYTSKDWQDLVISYKGTITEKLLSEMSLDIRKRFAHKPKLGKKIFAIFMELVQNIFYYSAEQEELGGKTGGIGIILITEHDEGRSYRFSCGNYIEEKYVERLRQHCANINRLDREALRELKRNVRQAPKGEQSKGAGIGLIHVALTAENPLDANFFTHETEGTFFALSVKIDE